MNEKLVGAGAIVERFGIPRPTLYWLAMKGRVPYHELPKQLWHRRRRLMFDPAEVADALKRLGESGH